MKQIQKRILWGSAAVLVLLALALPKLMRSEDDSAARPGGGGGGDQPVAVAAHVVRPEPIADRVTTTGTLRANEEVELVAEESGLITRVLFQEGARVQRGQLLVKINDDELRAQRASVLQRLQLARTGEERRRRLLEVGGVSREEYDEIRNQVGVLQAELERIDAQIAKTEIRAPFSGIVGLRAVSPGSYLSSQTPVATLRQVDPIKLDFDVPERFAGRVQVGSPVQFRVEGSTALHQATVYAVEPGIAEATRTLRVRARGSNPTGALRPGGFAQVDLILQELPGALMVPTTAVMPAADGASVYVVREGKAVPSPVNVGIRTADRVQIVSGVAPGDTVVTTGLQLLRPGTPVRVEVL